jgi:Mn2+/Fe2+ NRAMP family transporter
VNSPRSRKGTAEDRGKLLRFPPSPEGPEQKGFLAGVRRLGPGMLTGASDVDPALVLTATVAGAAYGYGLLWVVLLCIPFLVTIFSVSARIGHEARRGLVDLLREAYGRPFALLCALFVLVINMAMIVADLMAVSDALSILLRQQRIFFVAGVAFTVWYILIVRDYRKITRVLLWLSLPLYAYVAAALVAAPSPLAVLRGTFMPHISEDPAYVAGIVALFGSLLTPYVIVWQTSSRREAATTGAHGPDPQHSHLAGSFVTTLISFCIIVAAGSVLRIPNATDMTTRQAAAALQPAVGPWGQIIFALGILGAGMVALPVLVASMCYSLSEAKAWKSGLSEHPWDAKEFYVLISAALLVASVLNFLPSLDPVEALYWSQILAGVLTVPILIFILLLSNDRRIMQTVNSRWQNFWIGAAAGGLVAAGVVFIWWKVASVFSS